MWLIFCFLRLFSRAQQLTAWVYDEHGELNDDESDDELGTCANNLPFRSSSRRLPLGR
jgi:hypothetical protein